MLLHAENISVEGILENISLTIMPGQIVTIIGPNGAGKTTLIKALLDLLPITQGKLWKKNGCRIGYMPQSLEINALMPLRVKDFLKLALPIQDQEEILAPVGIAHLLDKSFHTLSGGEVQRVLLARALLIQPDILVLDEPAQGVDILGQAELYRIITQFRDKLGYGVLLVSHDLHLVMSASDLVICLNHHVCCSGHPDAVRQDLQYQKLFPEDALSPYTHYHDHHHA